MRAWETFLKVTGWSSEYKSVNTYLAHYKRKIRSESTRELVCDLLMHFCKFAEKGPDELVQLSHERASELLQSFVDWLAERGQGIKTVNVGLAYIKMFFWVNGFKAGREIDVERFHQPSRYRKRSDYVPTADEIYRMVYAAGSSRNRAMVLCLYTSGLRNSTLRALRYKDVTDELEEFEVVKVPVYREMKEVDPRACKGDIPYYTFFSKEAVAGLKEYVNERRSLYGSIMDEEPLFASTSTNVPSETRRLTHGKKNALGLVVKRAARRAGIARWREVHPHCLRKAFESALRNAGLDMKDQEFLMGHILPGVQDTYYDSSKVEDLRAKYGRVRFFKIMEPDKIDLIKAFAQSLGIDKIDVKIQKLREQQSSLDEMEALGRIMREELGIKPLEAKPARREQEKQEDCEEHARYQSRIVDERRLLPYIEGGWEIVKELRNGKLAIRRAIRLSDASDSS